MRRCVLVSLISFMTTAALSDSNEAIYSLNFKNSSMDIILHLYEKWDGKTIEVTKGVTANLSIITNGLTKAQCLNIIETELDQHGIGLFTISSNRLVATWNDPGKTTDQARKYLDLYKKQKKIPSLERVSKAEILRYEKEHPDLKRLREKYNETKKAYSEILMFRRSHIRAAETAESTVEKDSAEGSKYQSEYEKYQLFMEARQKKERCEFNYNIQLLECMIDDYEKKGKYFPFIFNPDLLAVRRYGSSYGIPPKPGSAGNPMIPEKSKLSGEELRDYLKEFQKEAIRKGAPPLSLPVPD